MACIELHATGQTLYQSKNLATVALKKKSEHTHQYPLKLSPVSERSAYLLQNYVCFSPLTSGLESFGHKSTPFDRLWIEAYYCPRAGWK